MAGQNQVESHLLANGFSVVRQRSIVSEVDWRKVSTVEKSMLYTPRQNVNEEP